MSRSVRNCSGQTLTRPHRPARDVRQSRMVVTDRLPMRGWFCRSKLEQGSEGIRCDLSLRLQHDLDAAAFAIAKLFVEVRPILKPALVSDHEGGIDLAFSDAFKQ